MWRAVKYINVDCAVPLPTALKSWRFSALLSHRSQHVLSIQLDHRKLWRSVVSTTQSAMHFTQIPNFTNSRWQTAAILKSFLVTTQQPIARFQWNFAWERSFSQNFGNGNDTRVQQKLQNVFLVFIMQCGFASGGFSCRLQYTSSNS